MCGCLLHHKITRTWSVLSQLFLISLNQNKPTFFTVSKNDSNLTYDSLLRSTYARLTEAWKNCHCLQLGYFRNCSLKLMFKFCSEFRLNSCMVLSFCRENKELCLLFDKSLNSLKTSIVVKVVQFILCTRLSTKSA